MTLRAKEAWAIFHERVAKAASEYCPASNLSVDPLVLNFINGQKVAVCADKVLQTQLKEALIKPDYNAPIFAEPKLPQIALSLFISGAINREQMSTLLEIEEAKPLGKLTFYPIFEEDNQTLSKAARWYLLPILQHRAPEFLALNSEQLEFFKKLVLAAPPSERFFYTVAEPKDSQNRFRNFLVAHGSMFLHQSSHGNSLVFPSFSVKNARLIARCGIHNTVGHVATLGKKTVGQIRLGQLHDIRYADLDYPGVPLYDTVHDYDLAEFTHAYNTNHDYHHALIGSITPRHFRHAMLYMSDLMLAFCHRHHFAGYIGRWDLIDQELRYFLHVESFNAEKQDRYDAKKFCAFLDYGSGGQIIRQSAGHLLVPNNLTRNHYSHDAATDFGVLVMVDMHQHPDKWLAFGLDPKNLTGDYKTLYEQIGSIYPHIATDSDCLQILKFRSAAGLPTENLRLAMCSLITLQQPHTQLKRNNKKSTLVVHSTLSLLFSFEMINTVRTQFLSTIEQEQSRKKADTLLTEIEALERQLVNEKRQRTTLKTFFDRPPSLLSLYQEKLDELKQECAQIEETTIRAMLELVIYKSELGSVSAEEESYEFDCRIM